MYDRNVQGSKCLIFLQSGALFLMKEAQLSWSVGVSECLHMCTRGNEVFGEQGHRFRKIAFNADQMKGHGDSRKSECENRAEII